MSLFHSLNTSFWDSLYYWLHEND